MERSFARLYNFLLDYVEDSYTGKQSWEDQWLVICSYLFIYICSRYSTLVTNYDLPHADQSYAARLFHNIEVLPILYRSIYSIYIIEESSAMLGPCFGDLERKIWP
jgi:hypothetical protein